MINLNDILVNKNSNIANVVNGYEAVILSKLALGKQLLFIAKDGIKAENTKNLLEFLAPNLKILSIPSYDTVPYDRISPNKDVLSQRIKAFSGLARDYKAFDIIITTVNAFMQRVSPQRFFLNSCRIVEKNKPLDLDGFTAFLFKNGFKRVSEVLDKGEYAVRGGILDVFSSVCNYPVRIDLFGDKIESIRAFDTISQKSIYDVENFSIMPVSEFILTSESITCFRTKYRELFGNINKNDRLYEAVSQGIYFDGLENWLPLFFDKMQIISDYVPNAQIIVDADANFAANSKAETVFDYFNERIRAKKEALDDFIYNPIPPQMFYLNDKEFSAFLEQNNSIFLHKTHIKDAVDSKSSLIKTFAASRLDENKNVYQDVINFINLKKKKKVVIAAINEVSLNRIKNLLVQYGADNPNIVCLPIMNGFEDDEICIICEQEIVGEKLINNPKRHKKAKDFIKDVSEIEVGDIVVHSDHGIGRYLGLFVLNIGNAPHDCLKIEYNGGDKLFVPVENLEMISRYGDENSMVALDALGSAAWQSRKAKVKAKIFEMAEELIKIAALRELKKGELFQYTPGVYEEFAAKFSYVETEDQNSAIADVIKDLENDKPMDRLICGDVGFGKTEVAMRAAFLAVVSGFQVAVLAPTTILVSQHFKNFTQRMEEFGIKTAMLSRLVSASKALKIRQGLKNGEIDIVIGTHAIFSDKTEFKNLGLVVIDEEQHFGVKHKEKLKNLKENVHVLTLTATPIPRTLQLAMAGVREMSVIATPPVDRMAVKTFVTPYDSVIIKEAITREILRGGQVFYVVPRIKDISDVLDKLEKLGINLKIAVGHGQMSPADLEQIIIDFTDKKYNVLIATTIIESGIDMPNVNTMIIHRADMFGLSQLYQLRGRIGRSKQRAYAYLTVPNDKLLSPNALKRLEVMRSLDSLGAGFTLASYDLDIRGAGNLLGQEQHGHIKEVGVALYQNMLEEAIISLKKGGGIDDDDNYSPQIKVSLPVLIPESYINDLDLRLFMYKKIANLKTVEEINDIKSEMADRFGNIPQEVQNLLEVVNVKILCRQANIEKIEAGNKGIMISFKDNKFPNPLRLIDYITANLGLVKLKPDHKLIYQQINVANSMQTINQVVKDLVIAAKLEA